MLIKHSISNNELRTFHTLFCSILKNNMLLRLFSCVQLFVTLWTVAHQVPLTMGFSRQEYWSRLPFPSPGDLPDPGIKSGFPALQADSLSSQPPGKSPTLSLLILKLVSIHTHKSTGLKCLLHETMFISPFLVLSYLEPEGKRSRSSK